MNLISWFLPLKAGSADDVSGDLLLRNASHKERSGLAFLRFLCRRLRESRWGFDAIFVTPVTIGGDAASSLEFGDSSSRKMRVLGHARRPPSARAAAFARVPRACEPHVQFPGDGRIVFG